MRLVVWKYPIPDGKGTFELELPRRAEFVSLDVEQEPDTPLALRRPVLYFAHWPGEVPGAATRFYARDTGQALELRYERVRFLGTYRTWLPALGAWNVRHVWMKAPE